MGHDWRPAEFSVLAARELSCDNLAALMEQLERDTAVRKGLVWSHLDTGVLVVHARVRARTAHDAKGALAKAVEAAVGRLEPDWARSRATPRLGGDHDPSARSPQVFTPAVRCAATRGWRGRPCPPLQPPADPRRAPLTRGLGRPRTELVADVPWNEGLAESFARFLIADCCESVLVEHWREGEQIGARLMVSGFTQN